MAKSDEGGKGDREEESSNEMQWAMVGKLELPKRDRSKDMHGLRKLLSYPDARVPRDRV